MREAVSESRARRIAISPIVGGQAIKGPAAKMLASLGHEVSAAGVAAIYRDLIDVMVIDEEDRALAPQVEALGLTCAITDTMMTSPERKAELASFLLELPHERLARPPRSAARQRGAASPQRAKTLRARSSWKSMYRGECTALSG